MAMAGVAASQKRPRVDPIGSVRLSAGNQVGRSLGAGFFNHFPQIIAAFPRALSDIVVETTHELGELSQERAPVEKRQRRGDPAPGNLRDSMRVRFAKRRGTDLVVTGRVDFKAVDPRGHRYARPLETGSVRSMRRSGRNRASLHKTYVEPRHFLVPSIVDERPLFVGRLAGLESRLPR